MEPNQRVAELLKERDEKVIFAESCTAGLASATLARIPGISKYLCGSFVTYRPVQKMESLGVSKEWIDKYTTESPEIAKAMSTNATFESEEADWSVAIVGDLGPNVSQEKDGKVFICVTKCDHDNCGPGIIFEFEDRLTSNSREERMQEAANLTLNKFKEVLEAIEV